MYTDNPNIRMKLKSLQPQFFLLLYKYCKHFKIDAKTAYKNTLELNQYYFLTHINK